MRVALIEQGERRVSGAGVHRAYDVRRGPVAVRRDERHENARRARACSGV